jgi:DNA-binding winged helix-turn-helix (wHTH) protein
MPDSMILVMLVERPGEILTREEIRERLWPDGTVVEFEHSINAAVNRLRDALGDSPGIPRYIETLPRRGYRFIGGVEISRPTAIASGPEPAAAPELPETAAIDKPPRPRQGRD